MTAHEETVAVVGTGDMGSAVGGALVRAGYRVVTAGDGRSAPSRKLAADAGIEDVGSLEAAVSEARLVLSIVPPAAATTFAAEVVGAMRATGARPVFADCNAVAPETVVAIARAVEPTLPAVAGSTRMTVTFARFGNAPNVRTGSGCFSCGFLIAQG